MALKFILSLNPTSRVKRIRPLFLAIVALMLNLQSAHAVEEAKVHVSGSASVNSLIFRIAQEKGFYGEEGLKVLSIVATSQAGIQGLLGGSFEFSQIIGQGAAAIYRGAPLRIVMVFETRPLFWLYGNKRIKSIQDLRGGKLVGVSSLGAGLDQMTRDVLSRNGVDPQRDIVIQGAGTGPIRMAALVSGALDATVLNPSERIMAKKQGLHELLFYGDVIETVNGGVIVAERTLSRRTEFVRGFLRATLRSFLWIRSNEAEAVSGMAAVFKIPEDEAREIFKVTVRIHSKDGTIPREFQERVIAFQKKQLKVEKDVTPENIYDFSLLQAVAKDVGHPGSYSDGIK